MPKLSQCHQCQFNARSQYLVCAIHPNGPKSDRNLNYQGDRTTESLLSTGYAWHGDKLIASTDRLTERDRLELLGTHLLFTGRCPRCDREFTEPHPIHLDCNR